MSRYDAVVIGSGLGGLTSAAILARAGKRVLVIEKSNSVGGAASSYKVGDLFVEGSLHETSNPADPRDPKHAPLMRAGVLDKVTWVPGNSFYEVRGGPVGAALSVPDNFDGARDALIARFPHAKDGIEQILGEMKRITDAMATLSQGANGLSGIAASLKAIGKLAPALGDFSMSLDQKLTRVFGDDEAVKCALAANLSYYHDDPKTLWWIYFAMAQGAYLATGARFIAGGSQRLSSALARVVKSSGGDVLLRRTATAIATDAEGRVTSVTHTAKDGTDPQTADTGRVISNAAPASAASLLPDAPSQALTQSYNDRPLSISLFALTLGLSRPPREFGFTSYSTQLLPHWMKRLSDYAQAASLMAGEPGERMPPLAIANYSAIESAIPMPPYVLSIIAPDRFGNWDGLDADAYRDKRSRWQDAIVAHLDREYPGLKDAVVASSFNTALSVRQYLGAPDGAVYGFAPMPPKSLFKMQMRSPRTVVGGLYLASSYTGFGGYNGAISAAADCTDMILRGE